MATTHQNKPSGKPGQRSRKAEQRSQKPDQQQSPKPDEPDAEGQIGATVASTNGSGTVAPADTLPISAVASVDAPSIGEGAPADVLSIGGAPADAPSSAAAASADNSPISIQTIANAYGDYTKRSFQEARSFIEKLMGVRSLDKAVEVQTEFAKQAYGTFVAESHKICGLYNELAKQAFRPWEGFAVKATQARR